MPHRPPLFTSSGVAILTAELAAYAYGWLLDGQIRQLSARTLDSRRRLLAKLDWFLRTREYTSCGRAEIRAFLAYVRTGHEDGRWGNPRGHRPIRPVTTRTYYEILRAFFRFLVSHGVLEASPMEGCGRHWCVSTRSSRVSRMGRSSSRTAASAPEKLSPTRVSAM
jgi:hypothetical protein